MRFKEGQTEALNRWWGVNAVYKEMRVPHQGKREIARRARQVREYLLHPVSYESKD